MDRTEGSETSPKFFWVFSRLKIKFFRRFGTLCQVLLQSGMKNNFLKMDLTEGSETSPTINLTPGKYPKENIQELVHWKSCVEAEGCIRHS
jgi:hypothetical protein